jgi:hypothetical protein
MSGDSHLQDGKIIYCMQTSRLTRLNATAQVDIKAKHWTKHIIVTIELTSEIIYNTNPLR